MGSQSWIAPIHPHHFQDDWSVYNCDLLLIGHYATGNAFHNTGDIPFLVLVPGWRHRSDLLLGDLDWEGRELQTSPSCVGKPRLMPSLNYQGKPQTVSCVYRELYLSLMDGSGDHLPFRRQPRISADVGCHANIHQDALNLLFWEL